MSSRSQSSKANIEQQYSESSRSLQLRRRLMISEFFRTKREESGRSREEIAEDIGLESVAALAAYEDGTEPIPLDDIFALTNVLNIAPEDVLSLMHKVLVPKEPRTI